LAFRIEYSTAALKALQRLDPPIRRRILSFIETRIAPAPRRTGEALKGSFGDYWKYRIGSYRLICSIEDATRIVLVLRVGDRKEIYR
jgi:mRNA interferase RelE/StbE